MAGAFDAVETVREVLSILEQQLVVVSLMRDVLDRGLTVAIGSETGVQLLAECALIVAPYEVDGDKVGTIGVLGPTRMNYPQALSAVAVVSRNSRPLTRGMMRDFYEVLGCAQATEPAQEGLPSTPRCKHHPAQPGPAS